MRLQHWLRLACMFFLFACQPQSPAKVKIVDNGQVRTIQTDERVPLLILTQAGVTLSPKDRVLLNGTPTPLDQPAHLTDSVTLQILHAVTLTLITPEGQQLIESSAPTVGQALRETGIQLYSSDLLDPPAATIITNPLTIHYIPSRELSITSSAESFSIRSSAGTVGEVLAEAGIPLLGLDYSSPSEYEAVPQDNQIRVVHVNESVTVALESIPYPTEYVESPEVPLGQEEVLEPGHSGLAITRTRIRYEDGDEVSRVAEEETVVNPPKARVLKTGLKPVVNSITVDGIALEYWRAFEMYATVYSPCNSGTGGCSYGTASGLRAGKGVVGLDSSMYSYLQGQQIYVPGYGFAVIGDIGSGSIIESSLGISRYRWIDLGFDDNNIVNMSGWMTIYFLVPAPASVPPVMQ